MSGCNGYCVTGVELGMPEYADAVYAHPSCPLHANRNVVAVVPNHVLYDDGSCSCGRLSDAAMAAIKRSMERE